MHEVNNLPTLLRNSSSITRLHNFQSLFRVNGLGNAIVHVNSRSHTNNLGWNAQSSPEILIFTRMRSNNVTYVYIRMNLWQQDQKNLQIQVAFHLPFLFHQKRTQHVYLKNPFPTDEFGHSSLHMVWENSDF